jgi:hypothetical protein
MTATLATPDVIGRTRLYLADVDHKSADEIRSAVSDFYRDFPTIAPLLGDVKIDPVFFADKRDSYAMTMPEIVTEPLPPFHVRLNAHWFAGTESRERFRRASHQDFLNGFHGYPETSGTIIHELGHVIDLTAAHYCGLDRGASWYAVQEWDAPSISGYAMSGGPMEAWADAFAARQLGYSPGNANVVRALDVVIAEAVRP